MIVGRERANVMKNLKIDGFRVLSVHLLTIKAKKK